MQQSAPMKQELVSGVYFDRYTSHIETGREFLLLNFSVFRLRINQMYLL